MRKKMKRSLLLVFLVVFMSTFLTGCKEYTTVSNIKASFNSRTITISSPDDNAFTLYIGIKTNNTTSYWESDNLFVSSNAPCTFNLESLIGDYISDNSQIISVDVLRAEVTDYTGIVCIIAVVFLVIGCIIGFICR